LSPAAISRPLSLPLREILSTTLGISLGELISFAMAVAAASAYAHLSVITTTASAHPKESDGPTVPLDVHTPSPFLDAGTSISVESYSHNDAYADAFAFAIGVASFGASVPTATASGMTRAATNTRSHPKTLRRRITIQPS